jgi:hypothetical protein
VAGSSADAVSVEAADDRRAQLAQLAEANGGLRELVEERLSLEEVFRDLIAAGEAVGQPAGRQQPAASSQ